MMRNRRHKATRGVAADGVAKLWDKIKFYCYGIGATRSIFLPELNHAEKKTSTHSPSIFAPSSRIQPKVECKVLIAITFSTSFHFHFHLCTIKPKVINLIKILFILFSTQIFYIIQKNKTNVNIISINI